jgi:hypothetical protein
MKINNVLFLVVLLLTSTLVLAAPIKAVPKTKAKCLKAGGLWQSWTKLEASKHIETCRIKARDAGKACLDGKDCSTKLCEFEPTTKTGICHEYTARQGCHTWMKDGVPESTVCVD